MHRQISEIYDVWELTPGVLIYRKTKRMFVYQRLQILTIRHFNLIIRRIHPFDGQFQSLSTSDGTHGRRRRIDFFGLGSCGGKQLVFFFFIQIFKVGHS